MSYLGGYTQNQQILLGFMTYDELNSPISADFPPTPEIGFFHANGVLEVGHATLTVADLRLNSAHFQVSSRRSEMDFMNAYSGCFDERTVM
ncbi:hypothetical protein GZH47_32740 (plasmid) [Paenibacillus rhizovicinus]|uniref:Uncharacterized protein n=1 Tax=Paenibacillus rhizovicinus TaxID=2704463 RepID=A0A6C0PAV5_9BACL|nr:hypothetical protein [Paenibacillus rhizovicinus]QHW35667.1 hypothetical protein GZH47_32740 [Paenibacillus rhizovicinus]